MSDKNREEAKVEETMAETSEEMAKAVAESNDNPEQNSSEASDQPENNKPEEVSLPELCSRWVSSYDEIGGLHQRGLIASQEAQMLFNRLLDVIIQEARAAIE